MAPRVIEAAEALASAAVSAPSPVGLELRDSDRIGRYLVLRRLGQGAMGTVYDAYDPSLERRVAVKVLRRGRESHESLAHEAKALARLAHPNVVQVYEIGDDGEHLFVAMELVHGKTLRTWLEEAPRASADVLRVFLQAGRGLAAAHRVGLVHCDFKPENVLVGDDGRVRVVDFGIAAIAERAGERAGAALVGTPAFMAPEQFLGEAVSPAIDQFAFCVALYQALFGRAPFEGNVLYTLRRNVLAGAVRPPAPSPEVPAWAARMLVRGLARDPAARFATMDDLMAEIDRRVPGSRELDPNVGRRERRMLAASMAVFGAVVLGGASVLRGPGHAPPTMPALIAVPSAAVTGLALAAFFLRRQLLGNRFARGVACVVGLSILTVVLHRLLALYLHEAPAEAVAVDLFAVGMEQVMAAVLFDRSFAFSAALFLGGSTVAAAAPAWALAAEMVAVMASSAIATVLWARDV